VSIIKNVALGLFVVCLPLLLLLGSISAAANSQWLYERGFEKYEISARTGLAPEELEKVAAGLIAYWNSGDEFISLTVTRDGRPFEVFNEREVAHLRDVKDLFRLGYEVLAGTLAYALAFTMASLFWWRDRRRLGWGLLGGGALTLALMLALGLLVLFDFEGFFLQFHLLSFANDFWQLDPSRDYLIMLFPEGFWYDVTVYCAIATAAGALVLGGVGWWLKRAGSQSSEVPRR
jgi:integral membrane protein (TIGR01906 family)